jgi:hypothetical protein
MKKITLNLGGQMVESQDLKFRLTEDGGTEYLLEDGQVVVVKTYIQHIFRLPESDPVTGRPQYFVKTQAILTVEQPDEAPSLADAGGSKSKLQ